MSQVSILWVGVMMAAWESGRWTRAGVSRPGTWEVWWGQCHGVPTLLSHWWPWLWTLNCIWSTLVWETSWSMPGETEIFVWRLSLIVVSGLMSCWGQSQTTLVTRLPSEWAQQSSGAMERRDLQVLWPRVPNRFQFLKLISSGTLVMINHFKSVRQVTWHARGDYFATVMPEGGNRSVMIHQLSKWRSQVPETHHNHLVSIVQCFRFHSANPRVWCSVFCSTPSDQCCSWRLSRMCECMIWWSRISSRNWSLEPSGSVPLQFIQVINNNHHLYLIIFNARKFYLHLRQYFSGFFSQKAWNCLTWSLITGGDNLLVGTYDKKVQWFDLDLSTMAYQVLRYHTNAVRDVQYHNRYPLFASCSDDNNITVSHGMVYNDLLQV